MFDSYYKFSSMNILNHENVYNLLFLSLPIIFAGKLTSKYGAVTQTSTVCVLSPLLRNALVKMAVCYIHTSTIRSTLSIALTFFFSTLCFFNGFSFICRSSDSSIKAYRRWPRARLRRVFAMRY
jgi:hypothetical protein